LYKNIGPVEDSMADAIPCDIHHSYLMKLLRGIEKKLYNLTTELWITYNELQFIINES
jgi:hypothetical protein